MLEALKIMILGFSTSYTSFKKGVWVTEISYHYKNKHVLLIKED